VNELNGAIKHLGFIVSQHRKHAVVPCGGNCWCWAADAACMAYEQSAAAHWRTVADGLAEAARGVIKEADIGGGGHCWYLWDELKPLRAALAAHDSETTQSAAEGVICPRCHNTITDADYWCGEMCLKCALEEENAKR
jgi:hypothetical protein